MVYMAPKNQVLRGIKSYHNNHYEDRRFAFKTGELKNENGERQWPRCHVNDWKKSFTWSSDPDMVFTGLFSEHWNKYEDRRWCIETRQAAPSYVLINCRWLDWTKYDATWEQECKKGEAICGMESNYSGHHKDRIYRFKCCWMMCNRDDC